MTSSFLSAALLSALLLASPLSTQLEIPESVPHGVRTQLAPLASANEMFELAQVLAASGFDDEALPFYRTHLEAFPDDATAHFHVARIAQRDEAALAIDRAVELAPEDADLTAWRILWRLDHGFEVTPGELAAFNALDSSDLSAVTVRTRLLLNGGDLREGLTLGAALVRQFQNIGYIADLYRQLVAKSEALDVTQLDLNDRDALPGWDARSLALGAKALTSEALVDWSTTALAVREYDLVTQTLSPFYDTAPSDKELGRALLRAYVSKRDLTGAQATAARLAENLPDDVDVLVDLATVHARGGDEARSLATLARAEAKEAGHPRVRQFRAQQARRARKANVALAQTTAALEADPNDLLALTELAAIHKSAQKFGRAAEVNERILRQRPWALNSWARCAQDYARSGNADKAREVLSLGAKLGLADEMVTKIEAYIERETTKER